MTTVVSKLFHLVQPDFAFFGEKDWQQLTIIKKMVADLDFKIEIVGVPTEREDDGLAMSNRNQYLSDSERGIAPMLFRILNDLANSIASGDSDFRNLEERARNELKTAGFEPDYVAVRDGSTLMSPSGYSPNLRVFGAARLGRARLIDNIPVVQRL